MNKMETEKQKNYNDWTKKEFEALPERKYGEDIGEFDSLVILPTKYIHDSGYSQMDYVAIKDNTPLCRLSGCSDVLHINGIGGLGDWKVKNGIPTEMKPIAWSIDCLKKSKLFRLFCYSKLTAGQGFSSFEIYAVK